MTKTDPKTTATPDYIQAVPEYRFKGLDELMEMKYGVGNESGGNMNTGRAALYGLASGHRLFARLAWGWSRLPRGQIVYQLCNGRTPEPDRYSGHRRGCDPVGFKSAPEIRRIRKAYKRIQKVYDFAQIAQQAIWANWVTMPL